MFAYRDVGFALEAVGTTIDGGIVGVTHEGRSLELELSPALFLILALLMRKAETVLQQDLPPAAAFINKTQLFSRLSRLAGITDPDRVTKDIWRLRSRLRQSLPLQWQSQMANQVESLVETSMLGYRLSVPPERLTLKLLDLDRLLAAEKK